MAGMLVVRFKVCGCLLMKVQITTAYKAISNSFKLFKEWIGELYKESSHELCREIMRVSAETKVSRANLCCVK